MKCYINKHGVMSLEC